MKRELLNIMKKEKKFSFINILYWSAMVGILFWFAYSKGWVLANFQSLDAKQAIELMEKENVLLLDVRTLPEYKSGHLRDATLMPLHLLENNVKRFEKHKDKKILVYCRSGNRSVSASRILEANGFTPINISGGIIELLREKVELVK